MAAKTFRTVFGYNDLVLRNKPILHTGEDIRDLPTYTIPEAATILAIPPRTLRYWFADSPIFHPAGHSGETLLLSFRDIAEAYSLELLRSFYGFHPMTLRRVIFNFRKETKMKRPLLEANLIIVLGNLVLNKPARGKQPVRMVDLAHERNLVFPELVGMIGHRIVKDKSRAPNQIFPWRLASTADDSAPVSLDPHVLSGRLVVTGSRIPVNALAGLKNVGKTNSEIAKFYELRPEQVEKALLHIERPIRKKAA